MIEFERFSWKQHIGRDGRTGSSLKFFDWGPKDDFVSYLDVSLHWSVKVIGVVSRLEEFQKHSAFGWRSAIFFVFFAYVIYQAAVVSDVEVKAKGKLFVKIVADFRSSTRTVSSTTTNSVRPPPSRRSG